MASKPVVYLLHGEDEFAIERFLSELETKVGDASIATLNISKLEAQSLSLEELRAVVCALPVLVQRRLVVVNKPSAHFGMPSLRQKFINLMESLPDSTALVLVEYQTLQKDDWLLKWAREAGARCYLRDFPRLKGAAMTRWIQEQALALGGEFTLQAAALLSSLVEDDARLANQEIRKLLAYVDGKRAVEPDDVENLTAPVRQGDIFAMVDALGNRDGRNALGLLHRMLAGKDTPAVFGMVVRQFRLLLLARDLLDHKAGEKDIARQLKLHPFVAGKVTTQAKRFSSAELELVYPLLLEMDDAIKSGRMEAGLALETFVAAFTTQADVSH